MNTDQEARFLIEKAEKYGVSFEYDNGILIARVAKSESDKNKQDEIILEIRKKWCFNLVRSRMQARAASVRARALIGKKLLSEHGEGELVDPGSGDGEMTIAVVFEGQMNGSRLTERAENLLFILDEEISVKNEAEPQKIQKGFIDRVRDGLR